MKNFISRFCHWCSAHKPFAALVAVATASSAFAEDTAVTNPLETVVTQATGYISQGQSVVVTLLSAGLIIVASFFIWRLIKRGMSSAK